MKNSALLFAILLVTFSLKAQEDIPFSIIEEVPTFPGCHGSEIEKKKCLNKKIQRHVVRHFDAELANELGLTAGKKRMFILFKIDTSGYVTEIKARAPHPRLKKEAIRIAKKIPKMIPGKQRGKPVRVGYTLPIVFNVKGSFPGFLYSPIIDNHAFTSSGLVNGNNEIVVPRVIYLEDYTDEQLARLVKMLITNMKKQKEAIITSKVKKFEINNIPFKIIPEKSQVDISKDFIWISGRTSPTGDFFYRKRDEIEVREDRALYDKFYIEYNNVEFYKKSPNQKYRTRLNNQKLIGILPISFYPRNTKHFREMMQNYKSKKYHKTRYFKLDDGFPNVNFSFLSREKIELKKENNNPKITHTGGEKLAKITKIFIDNRIPVKFLNRYHEITGINFFGGEAKSRRIHYNIYLKDDYFQVKQETTSHKGISMNLFGASNAQEKSNDYEIISGKQNISNIQKFSTQTNYASISVIDGGIISSNVCSKKGTYKVEYIDGSGNSKSYDSPSYDSGYIGSLPGYVNIYYKSSCSGKTKYIKIKINSPGSYDINLK